MAIAPRLDDTDPAPAALRLEAFASAPQSLIVLTCDPQLLETLRNVAVGHDIAAAGAEAELASHLMQAQGGVALIDAAAVTSPITDLTERLKAQFPDLVLVVAGGTDEQAALAPQITRGTVYRFLHKPLSEQRVKLFVAAAWRRHGEEHSGIIGAARSQQTRTLPVAHSRKPWWIAALVVLGALAILGWLAMQPSPQPTAAPEPVSQALDQEATPPSVTTETGGAISRGIPAPAPAAQPTTAPAQPSTTAAVPQTTPSPAPAHPLTRPSPAPPQPETSGLKPAASPPMRSNPSAAPSALKPDAAPSALAARIVSEAHDALSAGKLEEADRLIQLAGAAGADEDDLDDLTRKANEQRIAARGSAITRLSQLFNERLSQDRLLDPANDSAKHYLAELLSTDAQHPSTRMAREAYATRLLQEARRFAGGEDLAAARHWLEEARAEGAEESAVAAVEQSIAASEDTAPKANDILAPTVLNKLRHVDPEYPPAARSRDLDGWVDVELTVKTDGTVGNAKVVRSEPAAIFDDAALNAVRQWLYEPVLRDGKAVEPRTRVRIRFKIQ